MRRRGIKSTAILRSEVASSSEAVPLERDLPPPIPTLAVLEPRSGAGRFKTAHILIDSLTSRADLFLFSYSPRLKSLISWSNNSESILGVRDSAITRDGNLFLRHVHSDDRFTLLSDLEKAMQEGGTYRATYRWVRPDNNEMRWLHCRARMEPTVVEGLGTEQLLEGVIIDLSEELRGSVGKLADANSLSNVLGALPTTVLTLDQSLRIMRIGAPEKQRDFNFGDPGFKFENFKVGRQFATCFGTPELCNEISSILNSIISGTTTSHRYRVLMGESIFNVELYPITEKGVVGGVLITIADISEIAALERQLANVQRAEAIRLLAAGVSHNFNNALQGIIGQAAIIQNHPDRPELVIEASRSIIEVVNRTAELTRQLTLFDEKSENRSRPIDINVAAMSAVNKIEDLLSSGIKIAVTFGSPPLVEAPIDELVQIIQEVLRNGSEALGEASGTLALKTTRVRLNDLEVSDLKAGEYAKLSVHDTGKGMSYEQKVKCLDPFFTTKDSAASHGVALKGQGLGLSRVNNIVRRLRGAITVESAPNIGSVISIYIPASPQTSTPPAMQPNQRREHPDQVSVSSSSTPAILKALHTPSESHTAAKTNMAPQVLIIDDDLLVLNTVADQVRLLGINCVTADSIAAALNQLRTHSRSIDLVLLDGILPGSDGPAILRELKKLKRSVTVIGFTGGGQELSSAMLDAGAKLVLPKPVDPAKLKQILEESLLGP